jgi:hypothetical protein
MEDDIGMVEMIIACMAISGAGVLLAYVMTSVIEVIEQLMGVI